MDFDHTGVLIPKDEENTNGPEAEHEHGDSEQNIEADSWKLHFLACLPWERLCLPNPSGHQGPDLWLALILSSPIQHTQTTQESCLSPFIFVSFGHTSIYARSLLNSPSFKLSLYSGCCFLGALESNCNLQGRHKVMELVMRHGKGVWTPLGPTVTFTWFKAV